MSFKLLKKIITHLRAQHRCPSCGNRFCEDSFFVVATSMPHPFASNGLFFALCDHCISHVLIFVEINNITQRLKKDSIKVRTKPSGVSTNEILDMHNFLKTWKGNNIQELFDEASRN